MPSWVGLGGTHQSWAGATSWAAGTMGSSTYEGASDVSLSHLFHQPPLHLPVAFPFVVVVLCLFGFVCCFCFPLVLQVQGIPISHFSRVLDDRQCFTARSARHKKKTM